MSFAKVMRWHCKDSRVQPSGKESSSGLGSVDGQGNLSELTKQFKALSSIKFMG